MLNRQIEGREWQNRTLNRLAETLLLLCIQPLDWELSAKASSRARPAVRELVGYTEESSGSEKPFFGEPDFSLKEICRGFSGYLSLPHVYRRQ